MHIKHRLKQTVQTISRLPLLKVVLPSVGAFAMIIYIFAFIVERPVIFSYVGETCTRQMTWFPSWQQSSGDAKLKVEYKDLAKVGTLPFFSTKACFTLTESPQAGVAKVAMSPGGSFIARKTFAVTIESLPQARSEIFDRPIPTAKPLKVPLSKSDAVHVYQLSANQKTVDCQSQDEAAVQCDVSTLELNQDSAYQLKLERTWGGAQPKTVVAKEVMTLPATHMTQATI